MDVLTTPGVITSIVKNLDYDDEAIVGLFRLINDQRYRFELEPFCQHFKQVHEEHEIDLRFTHNVRDSYVFELGK